VAGRKPGYRIMSTPWVGVDGALIAWVPNAQFLPPRYQVYALCEPDAPHTVRYVGCSGHLRQRLTFHLKETRRGAPYPLYAWIAQRAEHGKLPVVRVLEETDREHAADCERRHIERYRQQGDLLNVAKGAQGLFKNHYRSEPIRSWAPVFGDGNSPAPTAHPTPEQAQAQA